MGFIDQDRVEEFWDEARRAAGEEKQTGYLQDEWPTALGLERFRREWKEVAGWLDRLAVPGGACLDVGCGVGVWLEVLAKRFARVQGIDLSGAMVASAQARMARLGLDHVQVDRKSVLELDAASRYDLIFVGGVLMYLNDDVVESMIQRLGEMLTPGGVLILRESTSSPETWYRDKPIAPGLHADPSAPRPPYKAIYRTPESYRAAATRQGLEVVISHPNRHYKIGDMTESWLRALDRLAFGRLARRRDSAERAARALFALRPLTLLAPYYLIRTVAPRAWKVNNWWYVCRRARGQLTA